MLKAQAGLNINSQEADSHGFGFKEEALWMRSSPHSFLYSLGRTRSTNVNREYISKLANDFAFKNIVTAEQGLLALRSGYDKKSQQAKADSKKKTNVPSWSNQLVIIKLVDSQAKLDEIRRRALAKLEKGKGSLWKELDKPKPNRASWVWQCDRFNKAVLCGSKSG